MPSNQHMWVLMTYFPLEVGIDLPTGKVKSTVTEVNMELAMTHGMRGCWFCHAPLHESTISTDCPGE